MEKTKGRSDARDLKGEFVECGDKILHVFYTESVPDYVKVNGVQPFKFKSIESCTLVDQVEQRMLHLTSDEMRCFTEFFNMLDMEETKIRKNQTDNKDK